MTGRLWLKYFCRIAELERKKYPEEPWADAKLTEFMGSVMDKVGEKMNCYVVRQKSEIQEMSREYLNIDAIFIDKAEYEATKEQSIWGPVVLPKAVVELENLYDINKISYDLWKVLCPRSPLKVLLCYQKNTSKVEALKKHLEDIVWQGSLMKACDGDLLIIIGDDSAAGKTLSATCFSDYFSVLEWRNDRLEKIQGLEW